VNLKALIDLALKEDMPNGDMTTDPLGLEAKIGVAKLIAKQDLVLSGATPFEETFKLVDSKSKITWKKKDGDHVQKNSEVAEISGPLPSLLKSERTALNFLGHLSGIATMTSNFVKETQGTKTVIIDTRKTTPGLRELEKKAVLHGGGGNHRMSLSDGILVKENHIRAAGSITKAVLKVREKWKNTPVEVEVTSTDEIAEALKLSVERLLLDNMTNEEMAKAVTQAGGKAIIEASGNMTLDRVKSVAKLGVNFISVGSITHSAPNADLSLLFEKLH
jgi:nicotinate-nucleotide pyrophosphorylase (carboxylating)